MKDKKISFIIVNHNHKEDIQQLISSLDASMQDSQYEIIIIDNGSIDGSKTYFSELTGNIIYHYFDKNIGYGAANNRGVELSTGSVLVLINPDTLIEEQGFDKYILATLQENIGVLAPKIVYPDGKIQPNCADYSTLKTFILQSFKVGYFIRKHNLISKLKILVDRFYFLKKSFIGTYISNFSKLSGEKDCNWVSGACIIMQKKIFETVSGFDEKFFLYCEDEDLCRRIAARGYRIVVNPSFTIVHSEGFIKSRKCRELTPAARHRYKSSIYYLEKHIGKYSANLLRFFYIVQHLFNAIRYSFIDWKVARTYFSFLLELLLITNRGLK